MNTFPSLKVLNDWMDTALTQDAIGYWADIRHEAGVWYVRDAEAESSSWLEVTPETMLKGWEVISAPGFKIDHDIVRWAKMDIEDDSGGQSDVYSLDAILQAGLFGDVIYS